MKKYLLFIFLFCLGFLPPVQASDFFLGKVERILYETEQLNEGTGEKEIIQQVQVRDVSHIDGEEKIIEHSGDIGFQEGNKVFFGEKLVVHKQESGEWYIADKLRLPAVFLLFIILCSFVIYFTGVRGITSLIGLFLSLVVLTLFVAPAILEGKNPVLASFLGASSIAFFSLYFAHGFSIRTTLAVVSTIFTLLFSVVLAFIFVYFSKLSGLGSEDAFYLQMGTDITLNLQGLLLGGIIIGVLGVLDDITTTQVAAISELKKAKPDFTYTDLYDSGITIGKEHILSLINTLALAYAGVSFPLFLMLTMHTDQPLWVSLNSEYIMEEVIRTLVGSITLILAVPFSTALAAWYYSKYSH